MFAVACFGCAEQVKKFEADMDDYSKIMVQALADRLAEAFAEALHHDMRVKHWGYSPEESCDASALHKIKYQGIRPAPGYPSQPDHTEKKAMWNLMGVHEKTGIELSDSLAMMPAAAVSALCFGHSKSSYFAVGEINKDQVEDYSKRKSMPVEQTERWLGSTLAYDTAPQNKDMK